ncbi:IPT/TIG domain containing protein [Reticulomyxa filosa]|uniref:IPT/TIG domain containing protein n=1 Tax=Reticulomyxa filosa TaxID=46433 RepID=X6N5V7_RETFI|nr:IPT/TIG domain containing protein [Reticulomyxa filosa]|eukprot:ETO21144.1 IPT/TIG domain containing protein [Reticulomyxa filosa]
MPKPVNGQKTVGKRKFSIKKAKKKVSAQDNDLKELNEILSLKKPRARKRSSKKGEPGTEAGGGSGSKGKTSLIAKALKNTRNETSKVIRIKKSKSEEEEEKRQQKQEMQKKKKRHDQKKKRQQKGQNKKATALNVEDELRSRVPKYIPKHKKKKEEDEDIAKEQLRALPGELLIPRCGLCHTPMVVARGDQCYNDVNSINCDNCGREDIHGEVWHCPKGSSADKNDAHLGYDLCKTCGYSLPRGLSHAIKRVGPPEDDLGLILTDRQRHRRKTHDGFALYKWDEIKKELRIGLGGNTPLCPFDCDCCF